MKSALTLSTLALITVVHAENSYLGLYIKDQKVGYSSFGVTKRATAKENLTRSDSYTVMDLGLLGSPMRIEMDSHTWSTTSGQLKRMTFTMKSGGRQQFLEAHFGPKSVEVKVNDNGAKTIRTLPLPSGPIVDDPMTLVVGQHAVAAKSFYILDPTTASFIKNDIRKVGAKQITVKGRKMDADVYEIRDPRANTVAYLNKKGDLLKAEAPLGIEMIPEPKAVALRPASKYAPAVDLAFATSLKTDKPIEDPALLKGLTLRLTGKDLSRAPSDAFQTIKPEGEAWSVDIHPTSFSAKGASILEAGAQKPDWLKPDLHVPSDSATFTQLARKIVGDRKDVKAATLAVKDWVYSQMRANAGIGVLRDASEVLATKEGVCRDYAILTATILRAAGIPTRLASGLVNWDGTFYYHAWDEVWDGQNWVAVDSTTPDSVVAANHVKLADGSIEQAFTFTFLDKVRVEVVDVRKG